MTKSTLFFMFTIAGLLVISACKRVEKKVVDKKTARIQMERGDVEGKVGEVKKTTFKIGDRVVGERSRPGRTIEGELMAIEDGKAWIKDGSGRFYFISIDKVSSL